MSEVSRDEIERLIALAKEADSPHIDLRPLLGIDSSFKVGLDEIAVRVLVHQVPAFSLEFNGIAVKVSMTNGETLWTLEGKW